MKAPDKVFFPNDINLPTKLSLLIKQKGDVCYIRKDALLEKINAQIKMCEELKAEGRGDVFYAAEIDAFEQTKRMIESL